MAVNLITCLRCFKATGKSIRFGILVVDSHDTNVFASQTSDLTAGIGIHMQRTGTLFLQQYLQLHFRSVSSCGRQGSLVFARGDGSPRSSLQDGAQEPTPNLLALGKDGITSEPAWAGSGSVWSRQQVCLRKRDFSWLECLKVFFSSPQ